MKKISNFLALLITGTIFLMGCIGLAACDEPSGGPGGGPGGGGGAVKSVEVASKYFVSAVKTTDVLTLKDLVVTAIYNDGSEDITGEYTVSIDGTDVTSQVLGSMADGISLAKGLHKCDITVDGKSYTYYIGAYDETADQIKVEAEDFVKTANLTGSETNFLEVVSANSKFKAENSTQYGASGTGSVGNIKINDTFQLHVTVAEAGTYNFYANVASTSRESSLISMASNPMNSLFTMKINGTDFEIPDEAVAHGHSTDSWGTDDWYYWTLVCFGGVQLQAGENVIEIKCYATNLLNSNSGDCVNIDYFAFQK